MHLLSGRAQPLVFNKVIPPLGNFSGIVGGITQDKNGYLWIATSGGLYQYDGKRFKHFIHEPDNPNSLSSSILEMVYADEHGRIWIATWAEGMDMYDPKTGTFTHFRHYADDPFSLGSDTVRAILVDKQGTLWVGTTGGLDRYDFNTKRFKHYQANPQHQGSISSNRVRKIYQDKEGTLWVATGSVWINEDGHRDDGGLNRYDAVSDKFMVYKHVPGDQYSLINNKVQGLFEDSRGVFWVGTAGDGLHTLDRKSGRFIRHTFDRNNPYQLSRAPVSKSSTTDHITSITEDALGNIWVGTLENGLSRYNPKTGKTQHSSKGDGDLQFPDQGPWTLFNSMDGILWIGTWQGGLYRFDPFHLQIPFVHLGANTTAFYKDRNEQLWIGTSGGLIKMEDAGGSVQFKHDPGNNQTLNNNYIRSIYADAEETLWVGTINGLNKFNAATQSFIRYEHSPDDPLSIGLGEVYNISEAGPDSLWIATDNGLGKMHKITGQCTHFRNIPEDTTSLSRNDVTVVVKTSDQNLWVGTYPKGGLNYLAPGKSHFTRCFKGHTVLSFLESADHTLWIGTHNAGVYKRLPNETEFKKLNAAGRALDHSMVFAIQEDRHKNMWVRTEAEIYRIAEGSGAIAVFGEAQGVKRGNLNYNQGYRDTEGKLYFGDLEGFYVFDPDDYMINPSVPSIVITNLIIGGKNFQPGKNSPITTVIEETDHIKLTYHQNSFDLIFTAIHYGDPSANQLMYKLENLDRDWRIADQDQVARYYGVPPGQYNFKIKAITGAGTWQEKSIRLKVQSPWWLTWWALTFYGFSLISLVLVMHNYQKKRVIKIEREKIQLKELEQAKIIEVAYRELGIKSTQLEKQKADLQTTLDNLKATQTKLIHSEKMASLGELTAGIAHEIQNPLNFVNNFSEVSVELLDDLIRAFEKDETTEALSLIEDLKINQNKISQHGKRADAIVKGMLLHARTSSGFKEMVDINTLVDEYVRLVYHGLRAKNKSFAVNFQTAYDANVGVINLVPQDIGRCLLNIINNAFYAVHEKSKKEMLAPSKPDYQPMVTITTKKLEQEVEILISDNGDGIPEEIKERIFQPFFTTKPAGEGTGLGLSLAFDIVTKGHGGELSFTSEKDLGTTFIIRLPY